MSGFVLGGKVEQGPPGVRVLNWHDDPVMRLGPGDYRARQLETWVHCFVLHATWGDWPQRVLPGAGAPGLARRTVLRWAADARHAGSHLIVDADGTVWCLADLLLHATYHAKRINEVSVGIELAQTDAMEIRQAQIDALLQVSGPGALDWLTARMGVQRQFHWPYLGDSHAVDRLAAGGADCVGVFGHRDQTTDRGRGDPGDAVFARMDACRYEGLDYQAGADLRVWERRQVAAGTHADGVPGPVTCRALIRSIGRPLWVARPGDAP